MGEAVSVEGPVGICAGLDVFTTPLEVAELVGRWVMGLVP
jgi:hypothetical protein